MPIAKSISLAAHTMIPLEDLGKLQSRYQSMKLAERAKTVLQDAQPALVAAEKIIELLREHAHTPRIINRLRSDSPLISKMRSCEARNVLLDGKVDFLESAANKIASWRKTMQRVATGEGVREIAGKEAIPSNDPLAMAVFGISHLGHYLSIVQLIITDLAHAEKAKAPTGEWSLRVAEMRRCATVISDYEFAAGLTAAVS